MRVVFEIFRHNLQFTFEAGTSRGKLTEKDTWLIKAYDPSSPEIVGWGEASPLKTLSEDYSPEYAKVLEEQITKMEMLDIPADVNEVLDFVQEHIPAHLPSIRFALETAFLDLLNGGQFLIKANDFHQGKQRIPINGLIWMGDVGFMKEQIDQKLNSGFNTIKMKIGAIDFEKELKLLESIRNDYSANEITLRVDANGAFDQTNVRERLTDLAALEIHSIEQPIQPNQWELMAELCQEEILPIALDEELIGVHNTERREELLDQIKPQYIILKPSLIGGMKASEEWIELAQRRNIGWWMTSMLESNVGLNAIAQFTASYDDLLPQGLGTGQLYHNNFESPLEIRKGELLYNKPKPWKVP